MEDKIILGMDPGTTLMGYGIVHVKSKKLHLVTMGVIHLNKLPEHSDKLKRIFERTLQLIDSYHPDEFAVEAPFYGKNVQSMLKLGRAQGVSMAAALYRNTPITEYSPRKIKQSITGSGAASKEQVAGMLQSILKIDQLPKHLDATDGLAVALCHHYQSTNIISGGSKKGWASFISQNPNRVK